MSQPVEPDVGVELEALAPLVDDLSAARAAWAGALPVFGRRGDASGVADRMQQELSSMSDTGFVAALEAMGQSLRGHQTVMALMAAEAARRSPAEAGKDGLAKQQGFQNTAHLVADALGGSVPTGAKLEAVGKATSPRHALTGQVLPPRHPHVADALTSRSIGVDAAAVITTMLDRVAPRADPVLADKVERILSELAGKVPLANLYRAVREAEARLDQDGIQPREEELRADRYLHFRTDSHGMTHVTAALDPETAAPVKAAIEAIVTHTLRQQRNALDGGDDAAGEALLFEDTRSIPQMQADALGMLALHAAGCHQVPQVPATTMVVRTELKTLTDGLGHGLFDGIDQPACAGTIRRLAATAGIIPLVMGGDSLPLDMGRAARLFTPAQRIALGERDGGCAGCGLDVAYTQAHHILWWKRHTGPTDLSNGVLLCPPCHTRVHHDGWVITIDQAGHVWFIPPPHVDPEQRPRLGGKARYGLPDLGAA